MEAKRGALRAAFVAYKSAFVLLYVNASLFWPKLWHGSPMMGGCHPKDEGGELIAQLYTKMTPQWLTEAEDSGG